MTTPTTNYGFEKPTVGGSSASWGTENNQCWDDVDRALKGVYDHSVVQAHQPGELIMGFWPSAPAGAVEARGLTIGNATSNATERAQADTEALFGVLWRFADLICPIFTSFGGSASRTTTDPVEAVNIKADYDAGKQITVPDLRDYVPRAFKSGGLGPPVGVTQQDAMQEIRGVVGSVLPPYTATGVFSDTGITHATYSGAGALSHDIAFDSANSTLPNPAKTNAVETRVKAFGVLACLAL